MTKIRTVRSVHIMIFAALLFCSMNLLHGAYAANILVALPMPLTIHLRPHVPIFQELARRGHNITVLSPFPLKEDAININEIIISDTMSQFLRGTFDREINTMTAMWFKIFGYRYFCKMLIDGIIALPELKSFLNDTTSRFDLIILQAFNCQEPFLALGHKYKVPVVALLTNMDLGPSVSDITGNTFSSSYVPNHKIYFSDHMNFYERTVNVIINGLDLLIDNIYWVYMDYYMKSHFVFPGFENLPRLTDMMKNISLFLMDTHISLGYPRPYLPNVIEIGGIGLNAEKKLPEDIEKFLNEAKDGVILLSWGQVHMSYFSSTILSVFLPVFAKLKQRVLMKWENAVLPGKPDNVKITPELLQSSVLAHPNVRLFISHGEFHGVSEAIYHGVPILGTPLFGSNIRNLKMAEDEGYGLGVDLFSLTKQNLHETLDIILDNSTYKEKAMKARRILRDRPLNALDNAVYWIEYVLRHNGASHFRSASLDLAWYQYWALDIAAVLGTVVISVVTLTVYTVRGTCRLLRCTT